MKSIEIVITNDAGETRVIASTHRISDGSCNIYNTPTNDHAEARRAMSAGDQMLASSLCLIAATHMLAVNPLDPACMAAVSAYHAATGPMKPGDGSVVETPEGDVVVATYPPSSTGDASDGPTASSETTS